MSASNAQGGPDLAMLDLFRLELGSQVAQLKRLLPQALIPQPATEMLDGLRRVAHALWGSARLVELNEVAQLNQTLRDCFAAAQSRKLVLNEHREVLARVGDWLEQLAAMDSAEMPGWLASQEHTLAGLTTALVECLVAGSATPQPAKPESPPPEPIPATAQAEPAPAPLPARARPAAAPQTAGGSGMDSVLMGLFLSEVETHSAVLNEGLLALEADPGSREHLDALMRSAHSIKGGARAVGLELGVKLAHSMEDCFVAAQQGRLRLASEHIDILLHCTDMLGKLAQAAAHQGMDGLMALAERVLELDDALEAMRSGAALTQSLSGARPAPPPRPPQVEKGDASLFDKKGSVPFSEAEAPPAAPAGPSGAKGEAAPSEEKDRAVRVTAQKIERLMGLAGEVVVNTRWLPPFSESLLTLKRGHADLARTLERLQELLGRQKTDMTVLKLLGKARETTRECNNFLGERLNQLDIFTNTFATHSHRLYQEVIGVRMRPFADGAKGFPRAVRDLARQLGKKVQFEILGKSTEVDQDILEKLDAPLNHLLRNALDHGLETPEQRLAAGKLETGVLRVEAAHRSGMLMISVSDDGRGIDLEHLRRKVLERGLAGPDIAEKLSDQELLDFLFLPGFSTAQKITDISGRGVGLDVVQNMAHEVGGVVRASTQPGKGAVFYLELPLTLSVIRTFLVEIAGEPYAFPLARIERCLLLPKDDIEVIEDRQYFRFGNSNIALVNIHEVLELDSAPPARGEISLVVVSDRFNAYGLVVDRFLGEYDLVVRPLDTRLGKVPDISAVAVMLDGSPVLIFDVEDLVHSINKLLGGKRLRKIGGDDAPKAAEAAPAKRILVVDDSLTVREMERKLLENQGYAVDVAVDGMDGWSAVRTTRYDLVVSDIDMPRMNGIEFIHHIKQHEDLRDLPVIIVSYKDSEEHRLQGLQAGANYYLTKSSFEDDTFSMAVTDLIGTAQHAD